MPITVDDIEYPNFNIDSRGAAGEQADILKSDLRQFRIRMYLVITIVTVMVATSAIYFDFMPLIFIVGLASLVVMLFNICVRSQDLNLDEFWLAFKNGAFWLLWGGVVVEHNKLDFSAEFIEESGLKLSNYVQITPRLHLAVNKKAAVALKLAIP